MHASLPARIKPLIFETLRLESVDSQRIGAGTRFAPRAKLTDFNGNGLAKSGQAG